MADAPSDDGFAPEDRVVTLGEIYEQLIASRGNLTDCARELGVSRTRLKVRIEGNPTLVATLEELTEGVLDKAEQNVFDGVMRGDAADSRFVLQTKGKERGWAQGVAGTGKNGEIVVQINRLAPPTEEA